MMGELLVLLATLSPSWSKSRSTWVSESYHPMVGIDGRWWP